MLDPVLVARVSACGERGAADEHVEAGCPHNEPVSQPEALKALLEALAR